MSLTIYTSRFCLLARSGSRIKLNIEDVMKRHICVLRRGLGRVSTPSLTSWQSGRRHSLSSDLKRFLEEVGTDPKEARFWLRQFQHRACDPEHPFAVLQIESFTSQNEKMMETLCSSLSFLHRNAMPVVLVYGLDPNSYYQANMHMKGNELLQQAMRLVDCLEKCYGTARAFCGSSGIIYSKKDNLNKRKLATIEHLNVNTIKWTFRSGHIPLLSSLSVDRETGVVTPLCPRHVAIKLSEILKPLKVILLNDTGGLTDNLGKIISHVRIPVDVPTISQKPWCSSDMKEQINEIASLVNRLPSVSSAVITSPDKIIKELFTHQGSGTIFQKTEIINRYKSLKDVDVPRLAKLVTQSFQKPLKPDYMEIVEKHLCSVYISESYSAAAVVIQDEENCEIPYLDKFVISSTSQGQGTSDALWDILTHDFPSLFWRSRVTNKINPWYFIRADGSWTNGDWTIFWYGVDEPKLSHSLVEFAANLPASFDPVAKHDVTLKSQNKSTTSYIQDDYRRLSLMNTG